MDDVLARQTGNVGTGTANVFALNDGGLHPLPGQGPGEQFASGAAAQDDDILVGLLLELCDRLRQIAL